MEVLDHLELNDSHLLAITTGNASSDSTRTGKLETTSEASAIEWAALRNHIPHMVHAIQLALGAFISSLGVYGLTKSWEAHEHNQQFGENESIHIEKSQRLPIEGNATIKKVLAMRPDLAKIIDKVCNSRYFKHPETDLHIAANDCSIIYTDAWLSK
jgi:hypothetical protein